MRKVIAMMILLTAGCGGHNQSYTFQDKGKFEAWIAGYEGVSSASCRKTAPTKAECGLPDGTTVLVLCDTADESGGHNCAVVTKEP